MGAAVVGVDSSQCRSLTRNRLTLTVLIDSPLAVIMMMAILFPSGALDADRASLVPAVQTAFWLAFSSFFFGLTYGLLQVVTELPVVRRDLLAGMRTGAYVAGKVSVLAPVLVMVSAAMIMILRLLGRLPAASWSTWIALEVTLVLASLAALALGLWASAAVSDATQATLALPMICFPQVLFAGGLVPVDDMTTPGALASWVLVDRWAFESLARILDFGTLFGIEAGDAGYGPAFDGSPWAGWTILFGLTLVALWGAAATLDRRGRAVRKGSGTTG